MVIHGDKLRWLFWLRWKLFVRGFTREKSRIITTIIMVVFTLPLFVGVAAGTFLAYRFAPSPANIEVLFLVLTGVYLLWIVLPLLEFTVNEGLDVSKLMLFPLTRLELMVSLVYSSLLDIPMFGLMLIFLAVIAGWAISIPATLFTIVAMLIFYVQVVGISQLVLALLMRTLQSRRFRDLSILFIALFTTSCYLLQQFALRGIASNGFINSLMHSTFSTYLQWLPPGMTARAIQQAVQGNWGLSAAWLLASLVVAFVVLYLWQLVLQRSLSTPEVGGAVRTRRRTANVAEDSPVPATAPALSSLWQRLISQQTRTITIKEWKYFWRDPQLKATLFTSMIYIIVVIVGPILGASGTSSGDNWNTLIFVAPLAVFFAMFALSFNCLGMERQSLTTLFLFPIEPRRILFGKNLAVATLGIAELVLLEVIGGTLAHNWSLALPALVMGLAGIGVVLGCGNFSSVFLPQRMRQMQRGFQATGASSGSAGCLRGLLSLAMMVVTAIILLPVAIALFVPLFFHSQWIWVFSIPAALLYGIVLHQLVTRLVAPRMLAREPEIIAVTTRE